MLVIPAASTLFRHLKDLAESQRIVVVTGLPGVGKSFLIQQLSLIAAQEGRRIHLLQWDVARQAFETPSILARYPEVDGVTAPLIRKAVGMWARRAVAAWHSGFPAPEHLLIGEAPLIGNRLSELVAVRDDEAEPLLAAASTHFALPLPSQEVRAVMERARARTIADPQHEKEAYDAPPNVLRALWEEVNTLARLMQLPQAQQGSEYNAQLYGAVYSQLLEKRHSRLIAIDQVLQPSRSVYESTVAANVLAAETEAATQIVREIELTTPPLALQRAVENWHGFAAGNRS